MVLGDPPSTTLPPGLVDANGRSVVLPPFEISALHYLERIAVALETLASDVKHPAPVASVRAASSESIMTKIANEVAARREALDKVAKVLEAPAATPVKNPQVGVPGTLGAEPGSSAASQFVEPAKVETSAPTSDVATQLEVELVAQEDAKRVLGAELHAAIWGVKHDAPAPLDVAVRVKTAALRILGGEEEFAKARVALGVKQGSLPTGAQMRELASRFLVPAAKANENPEHGDAWES